MSNAYDAYDATLLTYGDPAKLGYDPGAPWQRENDYYDALKASSDLSRMTAGNYQETGLTYVDGAGYVPWGEYVSGKYGRVSATAFRDGPDAFRVAGLPQGVDTRVGDYYQPDGSVAYQGPIHPPALMPTNVRTPQGDVQGYEAADFFLGPVPKEFRQGGAMGPVQWALSNEVSRSQPRANAFGGKSFAGAPGGIVAPGSEAYDYLRRMTPDVLSNGATDPNPFRGAPGTTTAFRAEAGDTADMYPGVAFYEATPDGGLKRVTAFTPGKEYFAVRESYDFSGFGETTAMKNAAPGTVFQFRTGNSPEGSTLSDFAKGYNVLGIKTPDGKTYTYADIELGAHGYPPGFIPGGSQVQVSKAGTPIEEALIAGEDPIGVAAAAYNMEGPESVAAMMKTSISKRFANAGFVVGKDGLLVRGQPAAEVPVDQPIVTPAPGETVTPTTPTGPTSAADFQAQMKMYIGSSLSPITEGRYTFSPGEKSSSYPSYAGTEYEDIGGKGWIVPVAESTVGANVAELKDMGATVYKKGDINKKTGLVDWVTVSSGNIEPGAEYVMVFTNSEIRTVLGVK